MQNILIPETWHSFLSRPQNKNKNKNKKKEIL